MMPRWPTGLLTLAFCMAPQLQAQGVDLLPAPPGSSSPADSGESSSLSPKQQTHGTAEPRRTWRDIVPLYDRPVRPFSDFGAAIKISTLGLGFDLVTPLLRHWNLRGSANFLDFGHSVANDGVVYNGELHLRSGSAGVDWSPRAGGFHLSGGLLIFNPRISGGIVVPGGMMYTLNGQTFTSSAADPIHGDAQLAFRRRFAPTLGLGFGNILPRSGKRVTMPVEVGFAYVGHSTISIALAGTACQPDGCEDVATDQASQTDLQQQIRDINEDLKRIQVYPILSIGVGYRF